MLAVMSVVMARVEHSSRRWPDNVESVIKQRCEFSYRCDGSTKRALDRVQWQRAKNLAHWYLNTDYEIGFKAQYYHKRGIKKIPKWAETEKYVGKVGSHLFYSCVSKYC